jgi:cell division protein FtsQ
LTTPTLDRPSARPAVDPRILARRVEVRRGEARKRLHRLIALGVAIALVAIGFAVTRSPLLDVDHIRVTGNAHTPTDVVLHQLGFGKHTPMTDVDLDRARKQLAQLPWVASASVQRSWPATVDVVVRERTPVATVPTAQGAFAVVDADGRVLEVFAAPPPELVVLDGLATAGDPGTVIAPANGAASAVADALHVAAALAPGIIAQVGGVAVDDRGVLLDLRDGGRIVLGGTADLGAKLVAASTVLSQVDLTKVCTIDVRVPSAPSLTRGAPCL